MVVCGPDVDEPNAGAFSPFQSRLTVTSTISADGFVIDAVGAKFGAARVAAATAVSVADAMPDRAT